MSGQAKHLPPLPAERALKVTSGRKDGFITNLDVKSAFGSVIELGADFPLNGGWFVGIDARKIVVKTKANGVLPAFGGAAAHADGRLNPLVLFAAVGRRF